MDDPNYHGPPADTLGVAVWILVAVGLGLLAGYGMVEVIKGCEQPESAWLGPYVCEVMAEKGLPWLQLGAVVTAPSILLTWVWRTLAKRRDQLIQEKANEIREAELEKNLEKLVQARVAQVLKRVSRARRDLHEEIVLLRFILSSLGLQKNGQVPLEESRKRELLNALVRLRTAWDVLKTTDNSDDFPVSFSEGQLIFIRILSLLQQLSTSVQVKFGDVSELDVLLRGFAGLFGDGTALGLRLDEEGTSGSKDGN